MKTLIIVLVVLIILGIVAKLIYNKAKSKSKPANVQSRIVEQETPAIRESRQFPRYDYSKTTDVQYSPRPKPAPKPVKRREDSSYGYAEGGEVPDGYVNDTSWYNEPTTSYDSGSNYSGGSSSSSSSSSYSSDSGSSSGSSYSSDSGSSGGSSSSD